MYLDVILFAGKHEWPCEAGSGEAFRLASLGGAMCDRFRGSFLHQPELLPDGP